MRPLMVISAAALLAHPSLAQNFYLSEAGPPGYPGPGGGSPYSSPFGGPAPTTKPSRPSFFRNPLAAASSLHKTVIAGIRAPAFLSNLLPSASAPRPSIFSFAKPPRGFPGASSHSAPSGPSFPSYSPEPSPSNSYPSFFGRPGGPSSSGPSPSSFFAPSSSPGSSPYAGLPPNVISALQNSQFDPSALSGGDQQEAATNVHEISGSPYDRSPPRIRGGFGSSGDESEISASAMASSLAGASSGSFDPSQYASQAASALSPLQGSSAAAAQSYLAQQASSGSSGSAPSSIAGYDIGVPVQLGFQSHSSDQGSASSGQQGNNIGPAYQIDSSSLQYPSAYQQQVSHASQAGQSVGYSGLATGYGAIDSSKQPSSYGQGQTFVVGSSMSYDGKTPSQASYASSAKPTEYASQGGYSGYSTGGQVGGNEALVQALKAYANGNVKYVPGKAAVPINHQLQQNGHATSTSYSTSSSTSSSSYASPVSAKSTKYASAASSTSYSSPVKPATGYSSPVKASSIRYSSNSGGLSYAESAPQPKYAQKSAFESTRTVGSSLKFGDSSSGAASASSSSSSSAAAKKKSS